MLLSLRLKNFRCYPSLHWDIPAEGAVLLGANAQGKTSLMEALCLALTLHSPRTHRLDQLATHAAPGFGLALETDEGTRRLIWEKRHLALHRDGLPCRDYASYLEDAPPVVWLSNRDLTLITGAAEERRRYLDFLGVQWHPAYRRALQAYRKALRSRNALLRQPRRDTSLLRSYAGILCRHGEVLLTLRQQLLRLLQPHIVQHHRAISGRTEEVQLEYRPSTPLPLREALNDASRLEADLQAGCTTAGPHRDDMVLTISGASASDFASEGQQRTLATALLLAQSGLLQAETGRTPLLLIDDIFGELDPLRRKALLALLPPDSQTFITTTHLDWLGDSRLPLPVCRVSDGNVQPPQ